MTMPIRRMLPLFTVATLAIASVVVIEFPDFAAAQAFNASPEYQAIAETRHRSSTGRAFVVEGFVP